MFKRGIALLLSILMVLSCLCVNAFAATEDTVKQYGKTGGYLAIGDSVSRGTASMGYTLDQDGKPVANPSDYYSLSDRTVEGSFPLIVAKAVGCNIKEDAKDASGNYWPICSPGQTLSATMDFFGIEDNYTENGYTHAIPNDVASGYQWTYNIMCGVYGEPENFVKMAKDASLITVELGLCDVFYGPMEIAYRNMNSSEMSLDWAKELIKQIYIGYDYWKEYYPVLIEQLQKWNPDAKIVMVGSYNIGAGMSISDDSLIPVGDVLSVITGAMNQQYKQWAKKYHVEFADISNVETPARENGWGLTSSHFDALVAIHPNVEGYQYIARQIINTLPDTNDQPSTNKAGTIVVDLGKIRHVDSVYVNGNPIRNYSMKGTVLTVIYPGTTARNLTVTSTDSENNVSVYTYQLAYHFGQGYTAYLMLNTNDLGGNTRTAVGKVVTVCQSIFGKLFDAVKQ